MDLNTLWFILVAVLYMGYFVLEGFDFGVGILLPFLGKGDSRRRVLLNTIGPHWDGNEVWLVTAGGATFAAFPHWYATLFSGFYLPLFLLLLALIVRGVGLEFRSKLDSQRWRAAWDWAICIGSLVPAFLWGVAFANFVKGVPIDAGMNYVGGFLNLLNPYALLGGLVSLLGFTLHGAVYVSLKTTGALIEEARRVALRVWPPALLALTLFTVVTYLTTDIISELGVNPGPVPIGAVAALLVTGWFIREKRDGWAFFFTSMAVVLATATIFLTLYPRLLISSLNPAWSLTIYNAASSAYTLRVMSIIALVFVPIVMIYQGWSYWIFRKRISEKVETLEY